MKPKSIIQGFLIIVALILVILTSGCVTTRIYEGEQRPEEQVAIIKGSLKYYFFTGLTVHLTHVDGIPCRKFMSSSVEVLPGWHEIHVTVDRSWAGWPSGSHDYDYYSLSFGAMPGHKYRVKSSFWKTKDALVTVVDTCSGEIVASQPR